MCACTAVSFDVEVDDTAAANLCNLFGNYRLVLTNEHVTLVDQSDTPVLSWQYRCVVDHLSHLPAWRRGVVVRGWTCDSVGRVHVTRFVSSYLKSDKMI